MDTWHRGARKFGAVVISEWVLVCTECTDPTKGFVCLTLMFTAY